MVYICLKCGVEFSRKYGARKYCSLQCSRRELQGCCFDCGKQISANTVRCTECRKKIRDGWPERLKFLGRKKSYEVGRQPRGRHVHLKKFLKREQIPATDPLWSLNFYTALIQDNECHYCLGPLSPTGHALDRKNSSKGHTAFNTVCCCWFCNSVKGKYWEYEHMMLLAPKLRKLSRERLMAGQLFRKESSEGSIPSSGSKLC